MYKIVFFILLLISSHSHAVLKFSGSGYGDIPDGPSGCGVSGEPLEITFNVSGIINPVDGLDVYTRIHHGSVDNLTVILEAPSGEQHLLFGKTGAVNSCTGYSTGLNGYDVSYASVFSDSAGVESHWWTDAKFWQQSIMPGGTYRTTESGGLDQDSETPPQTSLNSFVNNVSEVNGQWKLLVIDDQEINTGSVIEANLLFDVDTSGVISDGSASIGIDSSGDVGFFEVDGVNYAFRLSWYYRINVVDSSEKVLPEPDSAVFTDNKVVLYWATVNGSGGRLAAQMSYEIESTGSDSAVLYKRLLLTNISPFSLNLNLYDFNDIDIYSSSDDVFELDQAPSVIAFYDDGQPQYYGKYHAGGNNLYQGGSYGALLNLFNDDEIDDLSNAGLPYGPGDGSFVVQWNDISLEPGQAVIIQANLTVGDTDVPTPDDPVYFDDLIFADKFE